MDIQERYTRLPEPIKLYVTLEEYRWMSEAQRADLQTELTEPEAFDD